MTWIEINRNGHLVLCAEWNRGRKREWAEVYLNVFDGDKQKAKDVIVSHFKKTGGCLGGSGPMGGKGVD